MSALGDYLREMHDELAAEGLGEDSWPYYDEAYEADLLQAARTGTLASGPLLDEIKQAHPEVSWSAMRVTPLKADIEQGQNDARGRAIAELRRQEGLPTA